MQRSKKKRKEGIMMDKITCDTCKHHLTPEEANKHTWVKIMIEPAYQDILDRANEYYNKTNFKNDVCAMTKHEIDDKMKEHTCNMYKPRK
jgi:hypothetical protein